MDEREIKVVLGRKKNEPKKKREFSKMWLVGCLAVTVLFVSFSYILSFLDKNPVETLSAQIVQCLCTVDGVSFFGYNLQNSVRAYSQNKYTYKNNRSDT